MSTPLEVIEEGQEALTFEGKHYMTGDWLWHKTQTLALLQALHDELEGEKKEMFLPEGEEMPANVFVQNHSYNEAIQDQQDNLQALIKKIRV